MRDTHDAGTAYDFGNAVRAPGLFSWYYTCMSGMAVLAALGLCFAAPAKLARSSRRPRHPALPPFSARVCRTRRRVAAVVLTSIRGRALLGRAIVGSAPPCGVALVARSGPVFRGRHVLARRLRFVGRGSSLPEGLASLHSG